MSTAQENPAAMNTGLLLQDISVNVGTHHPLLGGISLQLQNGEIGCLLGASGCGKTTLLRTIAGFQNCSAGEIHLGTHRVASTDYSVAVEDRQVGMVFQDYALFPHLTVAENICFGLYQQDSRKQRQRLQQLLTLLELESQIDKYPHLLSGGQQQRVAIARAIAPRPQLLLLDEPFSNLDAELCEQLARELREVLQRENITTLMVSHNQLESFAMADRIGVLSNGRLLQWDSAFNLYHQPVCADVARFVGEGSFITGKVYDRKTVTTALGNIHGRVDECYGTGSRVRVLIRPDDILHDDDSPLQAKVLNKAFRGAAFLYTLGLNDGEHILSLVPSHHDHPLGEPIGIRLEIDHLVVFPLAERVTSPWRQEAPG